MSDATTQEMPSFIPATDNPAADAPLDLALDNTPPPSEEGLGIAEAIQGLGQRGPKRFGNRNSIREQQRTEPTREGPRQKGRLVRHDRRGMDRFNIDKSIIPPGQDYQWVRTKYADKPDEDNVNAMRENHWTPVPRDRHPGISVEKDGMALYERPVYLTEDARQSDFDYAMEQVNTVRHNVSDAPANQFSRRQAGAARLSGVRSAHNIAVPESDVPHGGE